VCLSSAEVRAEVSQDTISLQISGGPQRVRTADLRRAKAALSQLS
jgi:hypothetical protein